MNTKKLMALVLCAALVLALFAGCGGKTTPAPSAAPTNAPADNAPTPTAAPAPTDAPEATPAPAAPATYTYQDSVRTMAPN